MFEVAHAAPTGGFQRDHRDGGGALSSQLTKGRDRGLLDRA
jgi:hypothetical protein